MSPRLPLVVLALLALPPLARAQKPHPFNATDLATMDRLSDLAASPDGKHVVFTVRSTDLDANVGRRDLWLVRGDGSGLRQLTTHTANDELAQWAPDSRSVLFLSRRSGSAQVWRIAIDGGEPTQLTHFPLDVESFLVFPDGKRLLLALDVYPDLSGPKQLEATAQRDEEKGKAKSSALVYDRLLFRHWDTWEDGKRSHLFAWTIGGDAPRDLTPGFDGDAPPRPFGGAEELAISPDGTEVVFSARRLTPDAAWTTDLNLYSVPASGSAAPKLLTGANKAQDGNPVYSPDGKSLAYLAMSRPGFESDRQQIVLLDRASGKSRKIAALWDRSPHELVFSKDGRTLFASAFNLGRTDLFAIDVGSGNVKPLTQDGTVHNPVVVGDRLLFLKETFSAPAELFSSRLDGSDLQAHTSFNGPRLQSIQMGPFEQFQFPGAKGETVHAYLVKPPGLKSGQKVPVALLLHGGPQYSFGNQFHYRWNAQTYAGAGYAALLIDFHGSTGYGQAFTDSISGDWGGAPYEDVIKGLDFALKKYPFLDGSRTCALGASYGGYLVNWIAGQTDRFQCLVNHDGTLDPRMLAYETDELWFDEWEFGGTPWVNPAGYEKFNPASHVAKWKTPMLVIHGGKDYRISDMQGRATFTVLQRRGIPSRFVFFPDENHWVLKPHNSIRWHEEVFGWLDKWTRPGAQTSSGATGAGARR